MENRMNRFLRILGIPMVVFLISCATNRPAEVNRKLAETGPNTMVFSGTYPALPSDYRNAQCSSGNFSDSTFDFIYWAQGGVIKPQMAEFFGPRAVPLSCINENNTVRCSTSNDGVVDLTYVRGPILNNGSGPSISGEITISPRLISTAMFPLPRQAHCSHNAIRP
jgi:hypothetical protein